LATHPIVEERIMRADNEISAVLKAREQLVFDTSEFEQVKSRVTKLAASPRDEGSAPNSPVQ
jgi:hypothetical protein